MSKKILVIEDDHSIMEAMRFTLEYSGYEVVAAEHPEEIEAIEKNKKALPDLILLDILLSGKDGREICKKLKSQKATQQIPIIMMSAHPGAEQSVKDAGADDFIAKPFNLDSLLITIKKHV
ncbi:MAG: response regulator [Patescibacteria group bacterium]